MNEMMRILNAYRVYYNHFDLWFNICQVDNNDRSENETVWQITWSNEKKYFTKYFRMDIVYPLVTEKEGMSCDTLARIIFGDSNLFDELVRMVTLGLDYRSKYTFQNMSTGKYEEYDYDITIL